MDVDKKLLEILACPDDQSEVEYKKTKSKETLVCTKCKRVFPVIDGIPHMMPKGEE